MLRDANFSDFGSICCNLSPVSHHISNFLMFPYLSPLPSYPNVSQFSLRASSVYQSVRQVQLVLFIIVWHAASTILVILVIFAPFRKFCNNFVSSPDFFCPFAPCLFLLPSLFVGTFSQSYGLIQLHI